MPQITHSCAALSWIDPKTGLPEVDEGGHPGQSVTRSKILGEKAYRFSNFLEAWIETDESGKKIVGSGIGSDSGMYRSPSFAGCSSVPIGKIGRYERVEGDVAIFRQVVGCRTASPEKIGTGGGAVVGLGGSVAIGIWVIGTGGWGLVALGIGGGLLGGLTGKETAEAVTAFPPIWSEIEVEIRADGRTGERLIAQSLFPSCTFYYRSPEAGDGVYTVRGHYDAVPALGRWKDHGWGDVASPRNGATSGNPWHMDHGRHKLGGHTVRRVCPAGYTCQ